MIYLHKILPLFVSPLFIALALILYGAMASRWKMVIGTVAVLYVISTPLVSRTFFSMVEGPAIRQDPAKLPKVDAIVVLSGMLVGIAAPNGIHYEWSDPDRFFAGVELFKLGKSPRLIFTGGKLPWNRHLESEGVVLKKFAESMGVPTSQIFLTEDVTNTEEEAKAVRKLLHESSATILLVTSGFHMGRSKQLFESQQIKVIPYSVDFKTEARDITLMDFLPDSSSLALTSLGVREITGRTYYSVKLLALKMRRPQVSSYTVKCPKAHAKGWSYANAMHSG